MNSRNTLYYLSRVGDSIVYSLVMAAMAFLCWYFPKSLVPSIIFSVLAFLPLFGNEGRGYIISFLAIIPATSRRIGFNDVPISIFIMCLSVCLSLIIYIIIRRPRFRLGYLTMPWLAMAFVLLISFIYNVYVVKPEVINNNGLYYIFGFFLIIFIAVAVGSVTTGRDRLLSLAKAMTAIGFLITAETFTFFWKNPELLGGRGTLVLGWSSNPNVTAMFLSLTIAFFGILVYRRYWWYAFLFVPVALALMFTASRCGYLCLAISLVPLTLLSFRSYGKAYPYLSLLSLSVVALTVIVLFAYNAEWLQKIMEAFKEVGFGQNGRETLYEYGIKQFKINPLVGTSVNALFIYKGSYNDINLLHNTLITYMVSGGSCALACLAVYYFMAYYRVVLVKNPFKWHVLLFMAMVECIGAVDNGIVDPIFVFIVITAFNCLDDCKPEPSFKVKQNFFESYSRLRRVDI